MSKSVTQQDPVGHALDKNNYLASYVANISILNHIAIISLGSHSKGPWLSIRQTSRKAWYEIIAM